MDGSCGAAAAGKQAMRVVGGVAAFFAIIAVSRTPCYVVIHLFLILCLISSCSGRNRRRSWKRYILSLIGPMASQPRDFIECFAWNGNHE